MIIADFFDCEPPKKAQTHVISDPELIQDIGDVQIIADLGCDHR